MRRSFTNIEGVVLARLCTDVDVISDEQAERMISCGAIMGPTVGLEQGILRFKTKNPVSGDRRLKGHWFKVRSSMYAPCHITFIPSFLLYTLYDTSRGPCVDQDGDIAMANESSQRQTSLTNCIRRI